jgi:PAS domain S-box-containing protein
MQVFIIIFRNIGLTNTSLVVHPDSLTSKILVIDDDEDDFFIICEYIKNIPEQSFKIDWCYRYEDALDLICQGRYDLYFADYRMGVRTGLDLLKDAMRHHCEEPIILLTGKGSHKIDMEAMQSGATDYLVKNDLSTEKLERSIRYALERSATLKALKRNEKKFRNIFEKSKDAVFLSDEHLVFKDVNQAVSDLLGYSAEELFRMSLYDFFSSKKEQIVFNKELNDKGELNDKEVELLSKNKEPFSCMLSVTLAIDEKGEKYLQGIIHDITSLKKAERAAMLSEKLNATGRLMQILAHEVRNPLNNINLSVDMLISEKNGEGTQSYLDIINRNSKRIGDIISELLNSSRPAEIELKKINLQHVIDQTIAVALDRLVLKKIQINTSYINKAALIMGDEQKLKIALLNIIINAIEAITHGDGLISISISESDSDYLVSIQDNGSGISEENVLRLFEPYFTLKKNGLGLGLSSSFKILESHQSRIDVKTKLGEGTTFIITFGKLE